jgi:hypothetical protein
MRTALARIPLVAAWNAGRVSKERVEMHIFQSRNLDWLLCVDSVLGRNRPP